MKTKDVDPKETLDTLRQMRQKDRLVKMELVCLEEKQNKFWKLCQRPNHQ